MWHKPRREALVNVDCLVLKSKDEDVSIMIATMGDDVQGLGEWCVNLKGHTRQCARHSTTKLIHIHPPTVGGTRKFQFQNCSLVSKSGIFDKMPTWRYCTWVVFTKKIMKNNYFCPKYGLLKKFRHLVYLKVHTNYISTHNVEKHITTMDLIVHHISWLFSVIKCCVWVLYKNVLFGGVVKVG